MAVSKKINTLDTAITYGNSEEILGNIGIDGFHVVTKLPLCRKIKRMLLLGCLSKLVISSTVRTKRLYGLLLHCPQDLLGTNSKLLIHALTNLKNDGIVHKIGVSIYARYS